MEKDIKTIRQKLIDNGVSGLKEFGYLDVTKENILTDPIYKIFFKRTLEPFLRMKALDEIKTRAIKKLIKEIGD